MGRQVESPPSRPGDSLRRPAIITVFRGTVEVPNASGDSVDRYALGAPAKEGSEMLVAFLLLAGLLLWATGHMILR